MVAIKLAKIWHVTPDQVLKTRSDLVMSALAYEKFLSEYEEKAFEMNKETS